MQKSPGGAGCCLSQQHNAASAHLEPVRHRHYQVHRQIQELKALELICTSRSSAAVEDSCCGLRAIRADDLSVCPTQTVRRQLARRVRSVVHAETYGRQHAKPNHVRANAVHCERETKRRIPNNTYTQQGVEEETSFRLEEPRPNRAGMAAEGMSSSEAAWRDEIGSQLKMLSGAVSEDILDSPSAAASAPPLLRVLVVDDSPTILKLLG